MGCLLGQASTPAADPAAVAARALAELDRLAMVEPAAPEATDAVLTQALNELNAADVTLQTADDEAARDARARLAFLRGELQRRAALADPAQRDAWFDAARETFRRLRFDHRDRLWGVMGYIGESRVLRDRGDAQGAAEALAPLVQMVDDGDKRLGPVVHRAAIVERLEVQRMSDPAAAASAAAQHEKTPLFAEPSDAAPLRWLRARAMVEAAERSGQWPEAGAIADLARDPNVAGVVPAFERLSLLARIDRSAPGVMTVQERIEHAAMLAALGRAEDSLASFRAAGDAPMAATRRVVFASLLHGAGDHPAAAAQFARAAEDATDDEAIRIAALHGRAASLQAAGVPPADLRPAIQSLIDAEVDPESRRVALRWLAAQCEDAPETLLAALAAHQELWESDAALRYAGAAARWRMLAARTLSQPTQEQRQEAASIDRELVEAERLADESTDANTWCIARLARVDLAASPLRDDPRGALALLDGAIPKLTEAQRTSAMERQADLLLRLGLTDEALAAWDRLPEGAAADGELPLRLAELLAERAGAASATAGNPLRQRVVALTNRSLRSAAGDADRFDAVAHRAASALVTAGADVEARQVLERLRQAGGLNGNVRTDLIALEANVLLRHGRAGEALSLARDAAEASPDSAELQVVLGKAQEAAGNTSDAIAAYRRARELARAGSQTWWHATLALATAFERQGNDADASRLARAASTLHASPSDPALQAQLRELLRSEPTTASDPANP